jgi:hypothetical protein
MKELSRPTLHKIGLSDYCRFISIEDMESPLSIFEEIVGNFQPSIIDTIALGLEGELKTEIFNS